MSHKEPENYNGFQRDYYGTPITEECIVRIEGSDRLWKVFALGDGMNWQWIWARCPSGHVRSFLEWDCIVQSGYKDEFNNLETNMKNVHAKINKEREELWNERVR